MRKFLFLLILLCLDKALHAQYIYTIKADSVKITNTCDTAELIIENHTQNVPGFLFNKGRGRTEFRRGLLKITDSVYIVGGDTLRINPWLQGGNRFGTTGIFGTMDNIHVDFYSNSLHRARLTNSGTIQIGNMLPDNGDKVQVSNKGAVTISANLSRSTDRIQIGQYINSEDGQNAIIRTSNDNGSTYRNVLVERDGYIGLGTSKTAGSAAGIRIDDASNGSFILQGTNQGWARDMFVFTDTYDGLGQDVYFQDQSIIKIKSGIKSNNTAGNSTSMINIQPKYNLNVNSNPLTMRGIYYKPTLTSIVPGSMHIAIETVTGDVLLGTTSGSTGIGTNANGNLYYRDAFSLALNETINSITRLPC